MTPKEVVTMRESLGLSQAAFGAAIGLTGENADRTVRKWETDEREPPGLLRTLRDACREIPGFAAWLTARGRGG